MSMSGRNIVGSCPDERMKLLFAIKTMDSGGGGAERILAQVTGALAERGHDVTLLSFDAPESRDFYPISAKIKRIWLNAGRRHARTGLVDAMTRVKALRAAVRETRPDVGIGFMHSAYVPLALALAVAKTPVIASEHIVYEYYSDRPLDRIALRATARLYDRVTMISPEAKRGFPRQFDRRAVIIPNPVGPPEGVRANPAGDEWKTLLNVGRLTDQKDQETLVRAFALVAAKYPKWRLRIVGEGGLRSHLESVVRHLSLAERVSLPGPIADIWAEYAQAQLFVLSSRYESFGIATAEALALGLPVIGFAECPGTNELIEHGLNGLLVEGEDRVAALASSLDHLMSSDAQRVQMGAAGPAAMERFALPTIVDRWESVLQDAKDRHMGASRL
jgi:glycosyltransferase involved in cell wall biosynthesis